MDLNTLVEIQRNFDRKHGWVVKCSDPNQLLRALADDLVGLLGEVGEFANLIKKARREADAFPNETKAHLDAAQEHLKEELTDVLIYVFRLASLLNIDLENAYHDKLLFNEERYRRFLKPHPSRSDRGETSR